MEEHEELKDWRGTPINVGDSVIYASPKGRTNSFVEGIVKSFSPTNVVVSVVRESYGISRERAHVNVRPDRVTVVRILPPSSMPTVKEALITNKTGLLASYEKDAAVYAAGGKPEFWNANTYDWYTEDYVLERIEEIKREIAKIKETFV